MTQPDAPATPASAPAEQRLLDALYRERYGELEDLEAESRATTMTPRQTAGQQRPPLEVPPGTALPDVVQESHDGQPDVIAFRLTTMRYLLGYTQEDIARRSGLSLGVINRLETGARPPSLATAIKYAKAVGCRFAIVREVEVTERTVQQFFGVQEES